MGKKRVLIITQEMKPYTLASEIAEIARSLPQHVQENGMEIRVLMPKFGSINERRHRLHEVVRLSGMNIIVDDDDFPLIIKVASLPGARMQVYFLDNEDFFKRKYVFEDKNEKPFEDNPDRMVFFCKGVLETVKKFGWPPDVIHCHGWMTSLIPLYIKKAYQKEPIFQNAKVIYSVYNTDMEKHFPTSFLSKASINNLEEEDLASFSDGSDITLLTGGATFADGVIQGSPDLSDTVKEKLAALDKPMISTDPENYLPTYIDFYKELMGEEEE